MPASLVTLRRTRFTRFTPSTRRRGTAGFFLGHLLARGVQDNPGVAAPPPLFFLVPLLALWAVDLLAPTRVLPAPWRWVAGGALAAAGVAVNVAGALTQERAGTEYLPTRPTARIVQHGPYAWTRNPMYLGFTVLTLGLAVLADSAWALLAAPLGAVLVHRFAILREEAYLERKFGDEYLAYKRRVRRWL